MDAKKLKKQGQIVDVNLLGRAGELQPCLDQFDALEEPKNALIFDATLSSSEIVAGIILSMKKCTREE
mgnify:CR=1 FL=1